MRVDKTDEATSAWVRLSARRVAVERCRVLLPLEEGIGGKAKEEDIDYERYRNREAGNPVRRHVMEISSTYLVLKMKF